MGTHLAEATREHDGIEVGAELGRHRLRAGLELTLIDRLGSGLHQLEILRPLERHVRRVGLEGPLPPGQRPQ